MTLHLHFSHDWKNFQGMYTLQLLSFSYGFRAIGITIFNFAVELEFRAKL
jgi:hypothetical protein